MRSIRTPGTLFLVAVAMNYPWELAQAPLYAGGNDFSAMWWHCFVASLGDGVLVLLIYAVGWLAWHRQNWFERPGARGYALMLVSGLMIAAAVEWIAVHVLQRWSYLPAMPQLPGLDIGVVPIVQMLVLPPLIFRIIAARISRARRASPLTAAPRPWRSCSPAAAGGCVSVEPQAPPAQPAATCGALHTLLRRVARAKKVKS